MYLECTWVFLRGVMDCFERCLVLFSSFSFCCCEAFDLFSMSFCGVLEHACLPRTKLLFCHACAVVAYPQPFSIFFKAFACRPCVATPQSTGELASHSSGGKQGTSCSAKNDFLVLWLTQAALHLDTEMEDCVSNVCPPIGASSKVWPLVQ